MVDTNRQRIDEAVRVIGTVKRYCKNDKCVHYIKYGRRRFIGCSGLGYARHHCPDCGQWSVFEDEVEEVVLPT